jgi:hypothetical protein
MGFPPYCLFGYSLKKGLRHVDDNQMSSVENKNWRINKLSRALSFKIIYRMVNIRSRQIFIQEAPKDSFAKICNALNPQIP